MEFSNVYIKDLKVDSYKSLKDSTVELKKGLNIIIGKNGAGKSNLLEFIYRCIGWNIFTFRISRIIAPNFSFSIEYDTDEAKNMATFRIEKSRKEELTSESESPYIYQLSVTKFENGKCTFEDKRIDITNFRPRKPYNDSDLGKEFDALRAITKNYITFELPIDIGWVSRPTRLTIDEDANFDDPFVDFRFFNNLQNRIEFEIGTNSQILSSARNNPNYLKEYLVNFIGEYFKTSSLNQFLNAYSPISATRLNPNLNVYTKDEILIVENLSIDFLVDGDWMPWGHLSDGTRRLFFIISECLTLQQGIILVEGPELGVHPHQLNKVLDFLKDQSRTKQIVISTHSPLTLDILEETELDRIIIAKYEKGTRFNRLTKDEVSKAKRYMKEVGELSYYWLHSDLEK